MSAVADNNKVPLCVDCDGTLIATDLLHESTVKLLKARPWLVLALPWWLLQGKAQLKQNIAERVELDVRNLPYRAEVLALVSEARASGRTTVLATASHERYAKAVAEHVGVFDEVMATSPSNNLLGSAKASALVQRYGEKGFDYAGDSMADKAVWQSARQAIVVSARSSVQRAAAQVADVARTVEPQRGNWKTLLKSMRLHQWLKNLLVFVPAAAAHRVTDIATISQSLLAFLAFGLCASSVYLLNDLMDVDSDRAHVRKRNRPIAAGLMPIAQAAVLTPVLLTTAFAISLLALPWTFSAVLAFYFVCTLAYSLWLKRQVMVDVLMLAGLYTLRVIAGAAATQIVPSFWLLAFSMFVFLSLAMVKRYSEMRLALESNKEQAAGRGYLVADMPVLMSVGTGSGLVSVMVFALYINNAELTGAFAEPRWLWLVPPLLLYWMSRIWMKAQRGEVDDDPVVFAVRDWQSQVVLVLSAIFFSLAQLW
jgi:4-hydroxybenzoate polyprenyltransferase/phosphoserine phosphatase